MKPETINRALLEAIAEARQQAIALDVQKWRRDWIRHIAMHVAEAVWQEHQPTTAAGRTAMAWEAVQAAGAIWTELERYFAAEAEQETNDHAGP